MMAKLDMTMAARPALGISWLLNSPQVPGRKRSYGIALRLSNLILVVLYATVSLGAQDSAPWFGTWQQELRPPASRFDALPYTKVTTRIEPWGEGMRVVYDMVHTRGGRSHMEWVGRFDGQDYPVQGLDYVLTNAYTRLDDRRYRVDIKVDGALAATAVAEVSPDGRTMTVTTEERGPGGQTRQTKAVHRRRE
jgi:hypothetical protein